MNVCTGRVRRRLSKRRQRSKVDVLYRVPVDWVYLLHQLNFFIMLVESHSTTTAKVILCFKKDSVALSSGRNAPKKHYPNSLLSCVSQY